MQPFKHLPAGETAWARTPVLNRIFSLLNRDGRNARLVGGCVRDALMGRKIGDIDMACALAPEESMSRLEAAGVKVVPTGLKHGTITAVIEGQPFEITTLRKDVETHGRHATIALTDDWVEDARRRDFTVNAFYMDPDGTLYDPCNGWPDLEARHVRFIGNPQERIEEDALRILRFFRFGAQFGEARLDQAGVEACVMKRDMICRLSGERLAQEMKKLLSYPAAEWIVPIMAKHGILEKILPQFSELERFLIYIRHEHMAGRRDVLGRLCALLPQDPKQARLAGHHLRLSSRETGLLEDMAHPRPDITPELSEPALRRAVYEVGKTVVIYHLILNGTDQRRLKKTLQVVENWEIPVFPLRGRDLVAGGMERGPELGRLLKTLEQKWIESDFSLNKADLLEMAGS
tara:strand:+ start:21219 stop:22430 length:1212 start_codon:yes stop_codon:yes gene_type:complete